MALPPPKFTNVWANALLPPTKRAYGIHVNFGTLNDKNGNTSIPKQKICYGVGNLALVRDAEDAAQTMIFAGHLAKVNVVTPSPNGNWVASGDESGVVNIWAYPNLTIKNTLRIGQCINDLRWSADSAMIVAAGNGSTEFAKAFRFDSQNPLGKIDRMTKQVLSVDWSPIKPARVALSDEDNSVLFYHGVPFKYDSRSTHHNRYPNVLRFAPDGKTFATVGSDHKIFIYDGQTGALVKEIVDATAANNHTGSIFGLAWHKDSKELVTASADRTIKIWDVESSTCVHTWTATSPDPVDAQQCGVMWSPSENPVSVSLSGIISTWSRSSATPIKVIQGHHDALNARVYSVANKKLYTADLGGRICATDVDTGAITTFSGAGHGTKPISALAISEDGKTLYSAGYDLTIQKHDALAQTFGTVVKNVGSNTRSLSLNKAGLLVAALTNDTIVLLDGENEVAKVKCAASTVRFSPCGGQIYATVTNTKSITVFNAADLSVKHAPTNQYEQTPMDVLVTPEGQVFSTEGSRVIPWKSDFSDVHSHGWQYHNAAIAALALSPSGNLLISAGSDKVLVVWKDLKTFKAQTVVIKDAHPSGYTFVQWIDEESVITVSQEGVVKRMKLIL